jgi:hypothetical protein
MSDPMKKDGSWRYSGDGNSSRQFWGRVNNLDYEKDGKWIYIMGCMLQDLESRVLRALCEAEEAQRKRKKKATR